MQFDRIIEALENLPNLDRLLVAAYYCDGFEILDMAMMLEIPELVVQHRIQCVQKVLKEICDSENETAIVQEAFQRLFQLRKYRFTESYAWSLYYMICENVMGENDGTNR